MFLLCDAFFNFLSGKLGEYRLPDKTARKVSCKNRDELIRDVEVKYPQKKAVTAEIDEFDDDEEFAEFPVKKAKIKT